MLKFSEFGWQCIKLNFHPNWMNSKCELDMIATIKIRAHLFPTLSHFWSWHFIEFISEITVHSSICVFLLTEFMFSIAIFFFISWSGSFEALKLWANPKQRPSSCMPYAKAFIILYAHVCLLSIWKLVFKFWYLIRVICTHTVFTWIRIT